jgi:hypothetical protein
VYRTGRAKQLYGNEWRDISYVDQKTRANEADWIESFLASAQNYRQ